MTPGVGGAGNTHASRTGFYELNQLKEMARGQLPTNTVAARPADLQHEHQHHLQRLLERLVGELLPQRRRLLQHRRDRRRVRPRVGPRHGQQRRQPLDLELRAKASPTSTPRCGSTTAASAGTSPPATAAATATPAPPAPASATSTGRSTPRTLRSPWRTPTPPAAAAPAPCGGIVHCEGQVYSQAVWDLWNRDLVGAPFNLGLDVAA